MLDDTAVPKPKPKPIALNDDATLTAIALGQSPQKFRG